VQTVLLVSTICLPKTEIEAGIFWHLRIASRLQLLLALPVFLESRHTHIVVVNELSETIGRSRAVLRNHVHLLSASEESIAFARA
jgi:hypothetical protein